MTSNVNRYLIFQLLSQSDILNCQHSLQDLTGNVFAQKATLWVLYGRPAMASLYSQLLLHSEAQDFNAEATCAAVCHLAMQFMAFVSLFYYFLKICALLICIYRAIK